MTHVPPALVRLIYTSGNEISSDKAWEIASKEECTSKACILYSSLQCIENDRPEFPKGMVTCIYTIHIPSPQRIYAIVHPDSAARLLQLVEASKAIPTPVPAKTKTELLQELVDELRLNPYFGRIVAERIEHYKQCPL